ncbi:hypothetical protein K432DRAFT_121960 [Lepidopterella palustris CBS 459.81]|uniref:Uncharacterized protein n=1 Tax=Lepidopterella palustris CBS 459.81 TaxID=1314670 RepID=A0A8E2EII8_9PEZI|nr:hypothetical protein K432DRAFT_121960 [Lepidopterella palustris CBS 459.81]
MPSQTIPYIHALLIPAQCPKLINHPATPAPPALPSRQSHGDSPRRPAISHAHAPFSALPCASLGNLTASPATVPPKNFPQNSILMHLAPLTQAIVHCVDASSSTLADYLPLST